MNTKFAYITFLIFCTLNLRAQINLVPNPSFEESDTCYQDFLYPILDTIDIGKTRTYRNPYYWFSASYTPDHFKFCNSGNESRIPFYQRPRTGIAMVGLAATSRDTLVYNSSTKGVKENIAVKLKHSLNKNALYKLVFYINLANYTNEVFRVNRFATTSIGGHFSQSKINSVKYPSKSLAPIQPQVINDSTRYLMDTLGWDKVEGLYLAKGGEEWLTIGDFDNRNNDTLLWVDTSKLILDLIYYYIDDVSVTYFDTASHTTDTVLCKGRSLTFNKRPDWDSCIWYDGSHDSSKVFTASGKYWITNFYAGYTVTDTLKLTVVDTLPAQVTRLGFCPNDSVLLISRIAESYLWNNGFTGQKQYVNQALTYHAVGNTKGCVISDTFYVQAYTSPTITGLKDTVVCFDDLENIKLDGGEHYQYLWQPTGETARSILATSAMLYTLTVTDTTLCKASEQVAVDEKCIVNFYVPNAFSPNGDGINEEFKVIIPVGQLVKLEIYNRWGQLVESNSKGLWSGNNAPDGVYVIYITYKNSQGNLQQYQGSVTLLR